MQLLSQLIGIKKVKAQTAAGTTTITSDTVDMQNEKADAVCFVTTFNTAAADNILKTEKSSDDSAWSDVSGGAVAPGASDETQFVDIVSPPTRYVRASCARGTSTILGEIYALLYRLRTQPYDNTIAGTIAGKTVVQGG
jgi:hypothetical protein